MGYSLWVCLIAKLANINIYLSICNGVVLFEQETLELADVYTLRR